MKKKEHLILEIERERERFARSGQDTEDHDLAITFLKSGEKPERWENYEILAACVEDIETMYSDYDCN